MPKHIKILKHPETRKFYVSDVCEFHSVEVCGGGCGCLLPLHNTITAVYLFHRN